MKCELEKTQQTTFKVCYIFQCGIFLGNGNTSAAEYDIIVNYYIIISKYDNIMSRYSFLFQKDDTIVTA